MKKKLLLTIASLGLCVSMFATDMCVEKSDGSVVRFNIDNVKKVYYDETIESSEDIEDAATSDFRFFVLNDKEVEITGLNIASATVIVPAKVQIKGKVYTVTSIGEKAFSGREESSMAKIKQIILPNTITSIGYEAFFDCTSLTSINIPNSVITIGEYAFADCESLTSIEIPNSVTTIGGSAFRDCANLTSIVIPNSVTSIGKYAFEGNSFKSIVVDKDNKVYDSRENCNAIIETASNTLVEGCQNTVIPNSITSIASGAFYNCTSLASIEIPNSVTEIGDYAFAYCWGLNTARVPKGCKIGDGVFFDTDCEIEWYGGAETSATSANNTGLRFKYNDVTKTATVTGINNKDSKEITIPDSILYDGFLYAVTSIDEYAFYGCTSLTSVEIPESVTSIGSYAFWGCSNLKTAFVPKNCTYNSHYSFPNDCQIIINDNYTSSIQVVAGGVYEAQNLNKSFTFRVKSVEGSYQDGTQVVVLSIDGFDGEITLSDVGASYLIYDGSAFMASSAKYARENAKNVVMALAYNNSAADYTIISPTLNDTMKNYGAIETTFHRVK